MKTSSLENIKAVSGGSCEHENNPTSENFEDFVDDLVEKSSNIVDDCYDMALELSYNDVMNGKKRSFIDTFY